MKRAKRGDPKPPKVRVAELRERRRKKGQKQVTAHLSADAAELLAQMTKFSKQPQGKILSDAIFRLSMDYRYWGVPRSSDDDGDYYDFDYGPYTEPDTSHRVGWDGRLEENPHFDTRPVPPWIVEEERLRAASRKEIEKEVKEDLRKGLEVYRQGMAGVTGNDKKR